MRLAANQIVCSKRIFDDAALRIRKCRSRNYCRWRFFRRLRRRNASRLRPVPDQFAAKPATRRRLIRRYRPARGKGKRVLDEVGGAAQRFPGEMRVTLRRARMQMAEQSLHYVE